MGDRRQKLLGHLPRKVYDSEPGSVLALRVRNADGLCWEVSDGVLRLTSTEKELFFDSSTAWDGSSDFGAFVWEYQLSGLTIAQLAEAILGDRHEVVYENPEVGSLSALALLPGTGDQDSSNGDHLFVFTSSLWSILGAYAVELDGVDAAITDALRQMIIGQAEGEILDIWTNLYGVPGLDGESDADQLARFKSEALQVRSTSRAIERAVLEQTGEVVRVDEPWRRMFTVGESALSGDNRMQDGQFYTYHVIQVISREGADLSRIIPVVERNIASGIDLYAPRSDFTGRFVELMPDGVHIDSAGAQLRSQDTRLSSTQVLGVVRLDGPEGELLNYLVAQTWEVQLRQLPEIMYDRELWGGADSPPINSPDANHCGLRLRSPMNKPQNVAFASVCLSDGMALGDENCVFSRGLMIIDQREAMALSSTARLSDSNIYSSVELVERIDVAAHQELIDLSLVSSIDSAGLHVRGVIASYDPELEGFWGMTSIPA